MHQVILEKQCRKSSDEKKDQKLDFNDVEKMCHRENLYLSRDELKRTFNAADVEGKGALDFVEFRCFSRVIKYRPELERIFHDLTKDNDGRLTFPLFLKFMRDTQKVR